MYGEESRRAVMMGQAPQENSALNTVDFKKGGKMRLDGVIIAISQDTLERLVGNCMERHNQGPRKATMVTSNSKTAKDFSVRQ